VANFAAWASACGGFGAKVTAPGDVAEAVRAALAFDGPAVVDCDVNPDEPPMPGKIKYAQAKAFTQAFLRGAPHRLSTLATVARDKFNQFRD
jgi:pyruvate dehydrogenase (quinone)